MDGRGTAMLDDRDVETRSGPPAGAACRDAGEGHPIEIALVNNMPDAALRVTERQFSRLLAAAAGDRPLRLHFIALPGVARAGTEAAWVRSRYAAIDRVDPSAIDALVVTGCEPRADDLRAEPYWQAMAALVDWAGRHGKPALWSCLAAHAAVLHLDGIRRRRLPEKRFGVFGCDVASANPLVAGLPRTFDVPHSRWNELPEADLRAAGYDILSRSPEAGVDMFARPGGFLFLQGHPEYGPESLLREYRRDVFRYLSGESRCYPALPRGYFDAAAGADLAAFAARAQAFRDPGLVAAFPAEADLRGHLLAPSGAGPLPAIAAWLAAIPARQEARAWAS